MTTIYDFSMKTITGEEKSLRDFEGKVLLVVNVASRCGLTPQYEELEALYEKHQKDGFEILGFPANDFLWQEPGSDADIQKFCSTKYDVTFPLFSKIKVKGKGKSPLYDFLIKQPTTPIGTGEIGWNFEKFLVGRDGKVLARFKPRMSPSDPVIVKAIEEAIAAK